VTQCGPSQKKTTGWQSRRWSEKKEWKRKKQKQKEEEDEDDEMEEEEEEGDRLWYMQQIIGQ
jgi:hypothetical protein